MQSRQIDGMELLAKNGTPFASIAMWFQVEGPVDPPAVESAIRQASRAFGELQAVLSADELCFRPDLEPDVRIDLAAPVDEKALAKRAGEDVTVGFGDDPDKLDGRLLWRAMVLSNGWVMMVFFHGIADGRSRQMFLREFLKILNGQPPSEPAIGLNASCASLMGCPDRVPQEMKEFKIDVKNDSPLEEASEFPAPEATCDFRLRATQCNTARMCGVTELRAVCRQEGVTMTAVLTAALCQVVRARMKKEGPVAMNPMVSVDCRRFLPGADNLFGTYACAHGCPAELANDVTSDLFTVSRAIAEGVKGANDKEKMIEAHTGMTDLGEGIKFNRRALLEDDLDVNGPKQGRTTCVNISNTGVWDLPCDGAFKIVQSYSCPNQQVFGNFVWTSSMCIGDELFVTLGSVYPTLSPASSAAILDEYMLRLRKASNFVSLMGA